jgi:hypothetical protein
VGAADFRLNPHSPGIDAGNGDAAPSTDILGNGRVDDLSFANTGAGTPPYTDMGAYESQYSNTPPTASAGPDQLVTDTDRSNDHAVTLNGTGSTDSDGSIASYAWTLDGLPIASGVNPTVTLGIGTHTITLTVTDNEGATALDTVSITVDSLPAVTGPRCEGGVNPENVSTYTPIFSWTFSDLDVVDSQSHYQVQVRSSDGVTLVWDTGMVESGSQSWVYNGSELQANTRYNWYIQVWDQNTNPSGFSDAGQFTILDIGLRVWDGTQTVKIAVDSAGDNYQLRIYKNGKTYGIILVDPAHPKASKVRIKTSSGSLALKKM